MKNSYTKIIRFKSYFCILLFSLFKYSILLLTNFEEKKLSDLPEEKIDIGIAALTVNFVDPSGLETTIVINRGTPTSSSTPGTINVTATNTKSTFSGYSLEPPPNGQYNRILAGTYSAYQRSQSSTGKNYNPNRIQLNNVSGK